MLTKNIEYWAIYITYSETRGLEVELFDTFQDAYDNIGNYADYHCDKGSCTIKHYQVVDKVIKCVESIRYCNFQEVRRYNF